MRSVIASASLHAARRHTGGLGVPTGDTPVLLVAPRSEAGTAGRGRVLRPPLGWSHKRRNEGWPDVWLVVLEGVDVVCQRGGTPMSWGMARRTRCGDSWEREIYSSERES